MTLTEDQLLAYLRDEQNIEENITPESELFSSGLLDSVSMVGLINYIEEKTGATIPPSDVTLDFFDTISRIAAYAATLA